MFYLEIDEILAIHDKVIEVSGGRPGVLDFTLLHSASERPKATFGGKDLYVGVFNKATALILSLIQNHPFSDGNKRTGFVTMSRFLYINGYNLTFKQSEAINFVQNVQGKKYTFQKTSDWLKKHSKKLIRNFDSC